MAHGSPFSRWLNSARPLWPGLLVSVLVALAAQFVAEHHGAPAMLMALLFGMALSFLGDTGPSAAGIGFAARSVLRFGVAVLGPAAVHESGHPAATAR